MKVIPKHTIVQVGYIILAPIPGVLSRDCYETLLPVITRMVNLSLDNAIVPTKFKEAALNPFIKKAPLDHEPYSSYRPISNLRFVSKATEKIVAARLDTHLRDGDLFQLFQSAYRAGHSTEKSLTRVHNDILCDIDDGKCVILILLDPSYPFDTVDHSILFKRLKHRFGVKGKALAWLRSYLSKRSQFVYIENESSSSRGLLSGVPQGSVFGPLLYSMYVAALAEIIEKHNMSYHFYADDTQIYLSFRPSDKAEPDLSRFRIELCIQDTNCWMMANKLKLNNDKTDLLIFTTRHRPQPTLKSINAGTDLCNASDSPKNLGVCFDNLITMEKQIILI